MMITKPMVAIGFAAVLALAGAAQAQTQMQTTSPNAASRANQGTQTNQGMQTNQSAQKLSKADQTFLKEAIQGDMAEVQMGQLAQQKSQDNDVKQFGQMLQDDHGKHLQQGQQLAQQHGMTAPTEPSAAAKKAHERLSKMSGSQFDRAFARDMVTDHKKDIAKYEKEAKGKGQFASFAQQTLPILQKHLQTAQQIENKSAAVGSGSHAK